MSDRTERGPIAVLAVYPSKSSPGMTHEVRLGEDGVSYCTCRGGISHLRGGSECWHMKDYKYTHPNWKDVPGWRERP